MLSEKIIKLKQAIHSIGKSCTLDYVNPSFVEKMELDLNKDDLFKSTINKIDNLVERCIKCIEDYESLSEIKNLYSEAYVYSKLKALLHIKKVSETSMKTPDFRIIHRGIAIYVEMKSLNVVDGNFKHRTIMNEALDSRIDLESQIRNGQDIAMSEQVISPYCASNKLYDSSSQKMIIETLIDKISQNIKKEQFCQGDTVLLIDLSNQLLVAHPEKAIYQEYEVDGNKLSGVLFHTAFASGETEVYSIPKFACASSIERLHKKGILNEYPFIRGLIFHIDEMFYALAKSTIENINAIELMEYLCPKTTSLLNKTP